MNGPAPMLRTCAALSVLLLTLSGPTALGAQAGLVGVPALLPEGGYTRLSEGEMQINTGRYKDLHGLHITPLSLWMVNSSTGEVLNKHPFTRVRQ